MPTEVRWIDAEMFHRPKLSIDCLSPGRRLEIRPIKAFEKAKRLRLCEVARNILKKKRKE